MSEIPNVTRRTVLKTAGAGVISGTAFVGTTTGDAQRNFGYVDPDDAKEQKLTLQKREGRKNTGCGPSNIKIEEFTTEEGITFYAIPSSWDEGDTLEITDTEVAVCTDADLVEVGVKLVSSD